MIRISMIFSASLCAALAVQSPAVSQAPPAIEDLKRVVEQKEQELHAAELALTVARARLALAEGKTELAAVESRKLLRSYEGRLKAVQDLIARGRLCSDEPLRQAQGMVATARAMLAEAEGRREDLAAELPKVIAYSEWRIKRYRSLLEFRAISEESASEAMKEPQAELRWARERLASLRGDPTRQSKSGKGAKP